MFKWLNKFIGREQALEEYRLRDKEGLPDVVAQSVKINMNKQNELRNLDLLAALNAPARKTNNVVHKDDGLEVAIDRKPDFDIDLSDTSLSNTRVDLRELDLSNTRVDLRELDLSNTGIDLRTLDLSLPAAEDWENVDLSDTTLNGIDLRHTFINS